MDTCSDHTAPPTNAPIDFTAVARLLADAAVLVRTRSERGEAPSRDHRPRICEAIARAATLTSPAPGTHAGDVRNWAIRLAAEQVNAALGRGRHRDHGNLTESLRTIAGYGLDVGTLGAVNTAADLLTDAARTAERIDGAITMTVSGIGEITVYPIGPVAAREIEPGDLIELNDAALRSGAVPVYGRVQASAGHGDGTFTFYLALPGYGLHAEDLTHTTAWCHTVWRPVPYLDPPWQHTTPAAEPNPPGLR